MYVCTCRYMFICKCVCIIFGCPKSFISLSYFKLKKKTLRGRHNRSHAHYKYKETESLEILIMCPHNT